MSNLQSHTSSNPCSLVQYAALAAFDPANDPFVESVRDQLQSQRAVQLLAGSQTRALRLVPGGVAVPGEEGRHATFRSAPDTAAGMTAGPPSRHGPRAQH